MDAAVQAFKDKKAEKAAVKAEVLAALGRAKLAEAKGRDASADWAIVERQGFRSGTEGRLHNELQAMLDACPGTSRMWLPIRFCDGLPWQIRIVVRARSSIG